AEVFGDAPNVASRVETAAAPGTVLITAATQRLVSGLFVVEDRGALELKGFERPLQLYRVIRPSGMRGRFPATAAMRGMTPFVGARGRIAFAVASLGARPRRRGPSRHDYRRSRHWQVATGA